MNSTNNQLKVKFISKKKGKGVFAKKKIPRGEIIDVAPVLLISNNDWDLIEGTVLSNYTFEWDDPNYEGEYDTAVSLSISQFINHSYKPNVEYRYNYKNKTIEYTSIRDIAKEEEITVNYNGSPSDKSAVWFEVI